MKIFAFAHRYPAPFKPYYDTQFADFLKRGHDLTIFSATPPARDGLSEKVVDWELDHHTRRLPVSLRTIPACVASYLKGGLRRPRSLASSVRRVFNDGGQMTPREYIRRFARLLAVEAGEPDVCLVHGLGTAVHLRWLRNVFPDAAVVMYYHGGEVPSVPSLDPDLVDRTFEAFDLVFTNTEFSRDHAVGRGCPPERIRILPVGFDLDAFPPPPRERDAQGPLKLITASRMSEEKGHIYALQALKRLVSSGMGNVVYSMTGQGYTRPHLEEFVNEHGLEDKVRFLGTVPMGRLMDAMRKADVLLLPSVHVGNWVENQATAVQQGMLHGCLPVVTQTGGVPESIPPCMERFSVPERDSEALAGSLENIYRMAPQRREKLGRQCRSWVKDNYDIVKLNEEMLSLALRTKSIRDDKAS